MMIRGAGVKSNDRCDLVFTLADVLNSDARFSSMYVVGFDYSRFDVFVDVYRVSAVYKLLRCFGLLWLFAVRPNYMCVQVGWFVVKPYGLVLQRYDVDGVELIVSFDDLDLDIIIGYWVKPGYNKFVVRATTTD